jgi:hypothetical protein
LGGFLKMIGFRCCTSIVAVMAAPSSTALALAKARYFGSTVKQLAFSEGEEWDYELDARQPAVVGDPGLGARAGTDGGGHAAAGLKDVKPPAAPAATAGAVQDADLVVIPPPLWVPDQQALLCSRCDVLFTTFRRRHHCRLCGKVFCDACCNHRTPIPAFGYAKHVRVCRLCVEAYAFDVMTTSPTTARAPSEAITQPRRGSGATYASIQRRPSTDARGAALAPAAAPRGRIADAGLGVPPDTVRKVLFPSSSPRPIPSLGLWVPDDHAIECCQCCRKFTLTRRRHHCRGCGLVRTHTPSPVWV